MGTGGSNPPLSAGYRGFESPSFRKTPRITPMCGVFVMRRALDTLSHHGFAYGISLLQHVSFLFSLQAGIASAILSALAFRPVYRLQEATRNKNQAKVFLPLSPFTIFTEYRRRLGLKIKQKCFFRSRLSLYLQNIGGDPA